MAVNRTFRIATAVIAAHVVLLLALGVSAVSGQFDGSDEPDWNRLGLVLIVCGVITLLGLVARYRRPVSGLALVCLPACVSMFAVWWTPVVISSPIVIVLALVTTRWETIGQDDWSGQDAVLRR